MTSVCVVGGGIAGLSAALRLVNAGAEVVVVERDRLGGRIRTSEFAGRRVDEAADAFLVRVPWATALATELGLGDQLVSPAAGNAQVYVDGALRPFPAEQLLGVPTDLAAVAASGVLSPAGVAAAQRDLDDPGDRPDADEAVGMFIRRRLGDEVADRLVGPLVGGINAGDPDALSLAAVTPQLDAAARDPDERSLIRACAAVRAKARKAQEAAAGNESETGGTQPGVTAGTAAPPPVFAAPRRGMGHLVEVLAAELASLGVALRIGAAANAVVPRPGGGWTVEASDQHDHDVDAVVFAVPGSAAGGLLVDIAPGAAAFLSGIAQASVALVTLAVRTADLGGPLNGSGFLVPRTEGLLVTACSWSSSKWAHLAPGAGDGTALLRASVGRVDDGRFAELDDDDLVARVVDDLSRTMGFTGAPADSRVSRWPRSFPQYAPGHLDRVADAEAELAARAPTVALAGAALRGVGIPACVRSGTEAADKILAALA